MFRKILDRVRFEHQVSTYPYENDSSTPPGWKCHINIAKFLEAFLQVPAGVHAIQLFFGIVLPHGNVDPHEYKLL